MFASRLPRDLTPTRVASAIARARASGAPLLDLTETNPTAVDLAFDGAAASALAAAPADVYAPDPHGLLVAREAVARACAGRASVSADDVTLTASTSEGYSFLFKLLCDPGDAVLVPQPSYPLFDLLTRLEGVVAQPYQLDPAGGWCLDRESIVRATTSRTRALLLVSPNNPTGSMTSADDREWVVEFAASRALALIADEVFIDYPLGHRLEAVSFLGESRALTMTLGGLSKAAALPQAKLAWMVTTGPPAAVRDARRGLEMIADTYLSVTTSVQVAAPALIEAGRARRQLVQDRIGRNLASLRERAAAHPAVTVCEPHGGWSVVLRVPAVEPEERLVLRVLEDAGVVVHPGYFFDFPGEAYLVLSLLPRPAVFDEGVRRLLDVLRVPAS